MSDYGEQIDQLQKRLDKMIEYQNYFFREINLIRDEIGKLQTGWQEQKDIVSTASQKSSTVDKNVLLNDPVRADKTFQSANSSTETEEDSASANPNSQKRPVEYSANYKKIPKFQVTRISDGLEAFISKNIISLIGIVITVIGVAIGAKYAIDRDLISRAAQIVLGYVFAFGIFGTAVHLKAKYLNFSAILLSGAMAMLYFLTFFAYSFYNLIPQNAAFLMMLLITAFTFSRGTFHLLIRYISYAFVAGLMLASYNYIKQNFSKTAAPNLSFIVFSDFVLYATVLWIVSSELLTWIDIFQYPDAYKLGLSILWGIYALLLIVLGIYKKKKHLRIGAIVLFAGTLIKMFFYDVANLDTISKTIVFVTLGILLLIISFLYNKFKDAIFADVENKK